MGRANPLPAEQAAPAQANQMAAQKSAAAVVKNADPFAAELACPVASEQPEPAAARQADQAQVDAVVEAPPRGGLAASVFRRSYCMYNASKSLSKSLQHAAEELPLLQHDIDKGWRKTRCFFVLL